MRSRSLMILALAGAPTVAMAQESVLLRVGGQPGQAIHYQSTVDVFMSGGPMAQMQQMGADTTLPMTRMTMFQTRTLGAITGDTLTFTEVIDSAHSEMPAMPQMAAMGGQMGAMMRGMTTTTKMDRRARIFDVQASGGPMAMTGGGPSGPGGGRRGGMMGGGGGGGSRNMVFILPEGRVRPGDSWSDSTKIVGQNGQPDGMFRGTFRLERVERGLAIVSFTGSADVPMGEQQGMAHMNSTGEFRLDVAQGRLNGMTMTMNGTGPMGGTMRMVMNSQAQ